MSRAEAMVCAADVHFVLRSMAPRVHSVLIGHFQVCSDWLKSVCITRDVVQGDVIFCPWSFCRRGSRHLVVTWFSIPSVCPHPRRLQIGYQQFESMVTNRLPTELMRRKHQRPTM